MIQIHCSTLPTYADCPRRAATRIVRKQIIAAGYDLRVMLPGIGAAVGTGVHAAASYQAKEKMEGRSPMDGADLAIETFRKEIADGVTFDGTTPSANIAERQIEVLSVSVRQEILPRLNPVSVEPDGMTAAWDGVELSGRWDIEEPDGIDDYKTGTKMRPAHAQLGGYSLLRKSYGKPQATRLTVIHLPRVPVKKTYPGASSVNYDVGVCENAAFVAIKHIIRDIKNFEASQSPDVFLCNPASMLCSPNYCSAYGTDWCEISKGLKK